MLELSHAAWIIVGCNLVVVALALIGIVYSLGQPNSRKRIFS